MRQLFFSFFLLSVIFFTSCTSEVAETPVSDTSFAVFSQDSFNIAWNADTISVKINWKQTTWKLAKVSGMVVKSISQETGGNKSKEGATAVTLTINTNTGGKVRSEYLYLTNFTTNETKKIKLVQATTNVGAKITITPSITYQKVTGFGGMLNPSWTGNNLTDADVQKLYGDLGYNIIRMMLYPNKSDWGLNTATAKKAQSLGAIVFATPWTPPASMKSNGKTSNADGGYLLPASYADYAAHIKSFVDYQKQQGLNLYAVSVQNEPNWKVDYDGCSWNAAQMLDFVKNYGDQVGTKLIAAEAVNNYDKTYTNALLNDAVAVNKFDIVATHLYGSTIVPDALATQKGKEFWMTEHCITDTDVSATIPAINWTLDASLDILAKEINDCMEANMNAYVWWYLKRYYSMIADADSRNLVASGEVTKRGYIVGHYAKYATGKTRVKNEIATAITIEKPLLSTAYYGNNEITLVVINRNPTAMRIQFATPVAISSASAVETTETTNMSALETVIAADKLSATIGISGNSIMSVRLKL
ncbi:MAG: hypothetical protein RIS29_605 [Bacteroidota bacterium]|jgi:glucuronoarabinoxylan endo-1,4-beta-xylanase